MLRGINSLISGFSNGLTLVSGDSYSSQSLSSGAGTIGVADTTYVCPFICPTPLNGVIKVIGRVTTVGVGSNGKFGICTINGTTATMLTDLNPTGVATTALNDVTGTFTGVNLKGGNAYGLVYIGSGATMPIFLASGSSSLSGFFMGFSPGNFASTNNVGFTSAANTYAGGFASTFALTKSSSASVPYLGVVVP